MRLLAISDLWLPFPGGAERLMFNICRHLSQTMDVKVLTGYEAALRGDGPPVAICADIGVGPDHAMGAARIQEAIAAAEPDVLLVHHFYAHEFEAELVESGIPLVQVVLNGGRIPSASLAVFISAFVRSQADSLPQDLTITPPAFGDVVAASHGDAIGFIKPIPHKGVEMVYRIARRFPRRRFVILRGEWQDLEVIRPAPNIEFMEPVADIRDFYAECRLLLVPSLSEDAGTVAQEATLNGLPCLSSAVGGLVETNAGGVLLPPHDVGSWVRAIQNLDIPNRYRERVSQQERHLSAVGHVGKLDDLAERVLALGAKPR